MEAYLPDLPSAAYQDFLEALEREFTHTFGGCTILRGLSGSYLSQLGLAVEDRVNLIYTDTPFSLEATSGPLSRYTDALHRAAFVALDEEAVLIGAFRVHHAEPLDAV